MANLQAEIAILTPPEPGRVRSIGDNSPSGTRGGDPFKTRPCWAYFTEIFILTQHSIWDIFPNVQPWVVSRDAGDEATIYERGLPVHVTFSSSEAVMTVRKHARKRSSVDVRTSGTTRQPGQFSLVLAAATAIPVLATLLSQSARAANTADAVQANATDLSINTSATCATAPVGWR
jgi:hypothetical protein